MLTNTVMVLTVCSIGETWHKTIVHISVQALFEVIRNKFTTPIMELIESSYSSSFVSNLSIEGLSPSVSKIICVHHGDLVCKPHTTHLCKVNSYQQTVSQVIDFIHSSYESKLSSSDIGSAISVMVDVPEVSKPQKYWLYVITMSHTSFRVNLYSKWLSVRL